MVTGKALNHLCLTAGLHDYTEFMKETLFPKSGERPLNDLSLSVPDFIRSEQCENALTRQYRSNIEFCGGSDYYQAKIEQLRELRRKQPQMRKSSSNSSSSSSAAANSASTPVDMIESPELSKSEMIAMLKMMQKKLDANDSEETSVAANTRSSEKNKKKKQRTEK